VAPTPSYSVVRQGPTSLLTGWASASGCESRAQWVVGPIGGEINLTFSPLISPYAFNFVSHSITDQCIEHVLSSWSISILSILDRFNSYNTHLCTEINSLALGPFIVWNRNLCHKAMSLMCSPSALGDILFVRGSISTFLSLICVISLIWFWLTPLQHLTLYQCVWQHTWLIVIGVNYFNDYCCCQPLSIPSTGSINHFACLSALYHAIPYLCITLMTIILPFGAFPHKNSKCEI
jgi:hypothetical protein